MTEYLHGFHDQGGESLHNGKPGWTVITEEVGVNINAQGKDYTWISSQGIGVLVRLNYSHGGQGTIPLPNQYREFAQAVASFARTSKGVWGFIIGNEPQVAWERPQGVVITAEQYAECFLLCLDSIKRVSLDYRVGPAGFAPYTDQPEKWTEYVRKVYQILAARGKPDFLPGHAYTRSMNPDDIASTKKMDPPLEDCYYGFLTYQDWLAQVPDSMLDLPAFITEFDVDQGWANQNTGVITAAYDEVYDWNSQRGNLPKIKGMACFRWLTEPEVSNVRDWGMRNKPELLEDFKEAVLIGYKSPGVNERDTFLPSVTGGAKPQPPSKPDRDIDPLLLNRGVKVEEGLGSPVWRLRKADKIPSSQAGGRRNIYVEAYDESGKPVEVDFQVKWPGGPDNIIYRTNGKKGFDAGNFPMTPGAFDVWIKDGSHDSDVISGIEMGEETPTGWNAGHHTATILEFYLEAQKEEDETPTQPPPNGGSTPPPNGGDIPPLRHPITEPEYRILSQGWAARPDYYKQFNVDGVPLKGHEGLDFAAPLGSKVQAVADGVVREVGDQGDKGYGKYVKLVHSWGETVYAHLASQWVAPGETIKAGQGLGTVGYSGNVQPKSPAGAHLHFGLRKNPFSRTDGWGGYSDPTDYLASRPPTGSAPSSKRELVRIVREAAREFGLPENLLISLVHGESSFDPQAENKTSGAKGLGQITRDAWNDTAARIGANDIFNPRDNARVTAAYLKWCIDLVRGDERRGLWAYNWSPRDTPRGLVPPQETIEFASKVLHGKEVLDVAGS